MSNQLTNRCYWGSTALLSVLMVLSGLLDLFHYQPFVDDIRRLGYPEYLLTLLGIAKLFGVPALLYSGTPRLKEWAYAGFAFNLGGATISLVVSGSTVAQLLVLTVFGLLLTVSYITYGITCREPNCIRRNHPHGLLLPVGASVRSDNLYLLRDRLLLLAYKTLFTGGLAALFWRQSLAQSEFGGKLVLWQNRLLSGKRYDRMVDRSARWYGAALEEALSEAFRLSSHPTKTIVDCGTGIGFVSCQIARRLPAAHLVAGDGLPDMLEVAKENLSWLTSNASFVRAELRALPLSDCVADIVIAQNTIPVLKEFGRVCRSGGGLVFVESAVGSVAGLARRSAERLQMFDSIDARRSRTGFYLVARRV